MSHSQQLEICVDSADGLSLAVAGGADRIELCSALALGGLTPSMGLMRQAALAQVPCHAMIRPAAGDFVLREGGMEAMLGDILAANEAGLAGIVIGVMSPDRKLDAGALSELIAAAGNMQVTLHRAFDLCRDQFAALDLAIELGVARVLTSGGAPSAPEGVSRIAALCNHAAGRIEVMAGGGVGAESAGQLLGAGVDALHASCSIADAEQQDCRGIGIETRRISSPDRIRELKKTMADWSAAR